MKKICHEYNPNCICADCVHGSRMMPIGGLPCCVKHRLNCVGAECKNHFRTKHREEEIDEQDEMMPRTYGHRTV